jgi:hypothetical protein
VRTRATLVTALAATLALVLTEDAASATAKTVICSQIKNGPHAAYTFALNQKKLSGSTWTVFATGVPCKVALATAPAILKWWAKAKIGAYDFKQNGLSCTKEQDAHGSSGTTGCAYSKGSGSNIELMMTAAYTIPQLKQMFYISP